MRRRPRCRPPPRAGRAPRPRPRPRSRRRRPSAPRLGPPRPTPARPPGPLDAWPGRSRRLPRGRARLPWGRRGRSPPCGCLGLLSSPSSAAAFPRPSRPHAPRRTCPRRPRAPPSRRAGRRPPGRSPASPHRRASASLPPRAGLRRVGTICPRVRLPARRAWKGVPSPLRRGLPPRRAGRLPPRRFPGRRARSPRRRPR